MGYLRYKFMVFAVAIGFIFVVGYFSDQASEPASPKGLFGSERTSGDAASTTASLSSSSQSLRATGDFACTVASITDGDTLRCVEADASGRQIRIRLSGVAARERDGSCSPGHPCPEASAEAATAELERVAADQVLTCRQVGTSYGRIAAFCQRSDGTDINCAMVASGTALRWERHWQGHRC